MKQRSFAVIGSRKLYDVLKDLLARNQPNAISYFDVGGIRYRHVPELRQAHGIEWSGYVPLPDAEPEVIAGLMVLVKP